MAVHNDSRWKSSNNIETRDSGKGLVGWVVSQCSSEVCEPDWLIQSRPASVEAGSERHKVQKTQSDDVAQIHLGASGPNGILRERTYSQTSI